MNTVIENLKKQFDVLNVIDLGQWDETNYEKSQQWLIQTLVSLYRDSYSSAQRLVFLHTKDLYVDKEPAGLILKNLHKNFKDCFKNLLIGIYKLHQARIVNRDIKEENITANYNEETKKVEMRFIDFGLSEYLTPKHCNNYKNINFKGTPDFVPPEIIVALFTYENYNKNKDINYIFLKIQKYYKEYDISEIFSSIKESNMLVEFNNTLIDLIKGIYNDLIKKTFLPKYFGSQANKFNGYLQKADIYALGIAMYEFLEVFTDFINVKKDIRLHNLLQNMIKTHPDKRYNVVDCLKHPYFK